MRLKTRSASHAGVNFEKFGGEQNGSEKES
jgi:hypothetical protein